MNKWSTWNTSI